MTELREITRVRQIARESPRRWFTSKDLDLIVWLDGRGGPQAFQLCYDKGHRERALTWHPRHGYGHMAVDDGEQRGFSHKGTPVLVADGVFNAARVLERFMAECHSLPADVVAYCGETVTRVSRRRLRLWDGVVSMHG